MHLHHYCLIVLIAVAPGVPDLRGPAYGESAGSPGLRGPAYAQSAQKPAVPQEKPAAKTTVDTKELPVSLDRIQKALANTPRLRFDTEGRPVYRVQVFGENPTIDDILGPDWAKGPVKYGTMTHQEFLTMVTPQEHQGYAGFTNKEGATIAATSLALQWTLQKALTKFRESQDAREREAARKEVMDALNALEAARAKAGRAPK